MGLQFFEVPDTKLIGLQGTNYSRENGNFTYEQRHCRFYSQQNRSDESKTYPHRYHYNRATVALHPSEVPRQAQKSG
jgi:hypothetical protein